MSLLLPSAAVSGPSTSPGTSAATRYDEQSQNASGSFGEALARSLLPGAEQAEKVVVKTAPLPPGRRQADKPEGDVQDLVNALGLAFFPPESRTPRAALSVAAETPPATSALPATAAPGLMAPATITRSATAAPGLMAPATPGPETVATSLAAPASPLQGAAAASLNALPVGTPAPAEGAAATQQANGNAGAQTGLTPALAAASQKDASQNLQQVPSTVSDGPALVAVGSNVSAQASASDRGFPEQSFKHDGKGSPMQGDSTEADTGLMPAPMHGTSPAANRMADPAREAAALPPSIASADAQQDGQVSVNTTLPVNLVSPGAQGPVSAATAGANAPPAVMTASLAPEVGSHEWGQSLGQQVVQLGRAGHQVTELQLNPPGLGPLKVTLSMNDQQMQAVFVSAHSSVRAAVEAALPQLRSALADNGISLGNTSVGAESQQQTAFSNGKDNPSHNPTHRGTYRAAETVDTSARIPNRTALEPVRRGNGISIDTYA